MSTGHVLSLITSIEVIIKQMRNGGDMGFITNQKRLAEEIDFSVEHVSRFVNRRSCYSRKLVEAINRVTGIDKYKLATGKADAVKSALAAFYRNEVKRMSQ
jgi:hypothetical protein